MERKELEKKKQQIREELDALDSDEREYVAKGFSKTEARRLTDPKRSFLLGMLEETEHELGLTSG
jgi:hypothetical protein